MRKKGADMDLLPVLGASAATGLLSSVLTVVALKVDMRWVKEKVNDHERRIRELETMVMTCLNHSQ
ncbi:hypothetical protein [Enterovibrio norvegicus]|uniref:hypothetical protein n=2 Tax=Enterovibrio norvegicus TaxID=188144 RepID=UPI0010BF3BB1|nr:hypothetical protein [Enterovibrio norvegicus]